MTAPTPAVERAARAIACSVRDPWDTQTVQEALTAALTDPDDPDFLARTLFVLHHSRALTPELALIHWNARAETHRAEWREMADGLRMMLTGQGS